MPRKTDSNCPADWIYMAEADMRAIRRLARERVGYRLCRSKLAEVLEKVLKAELIRRGWFLKKTHDLAMLADELAGRAPSLPEGLEDAVEALAESYFADRYPGFDLDDPDWPALDALFGIVGRFMRDTKRAIRPQRVKQQKA